MSMIKETIIALLKKKSKGAIIRNSKLSDVCHISGGTRFYSSSINDYSYIGRNSYFYKTDIGRYCSIADGCNCGMPEHRLDTVSTSQVFLEGRNCLKTNFGKLPHPEYQRTEIGSDVWIGMGAMIRAGVKIGMGAVIGMGSVVTKDVPEYAIVAGNPVKILRYRVDEDTRKRLMESAWWELDGRIIEKLADYFDEPETLLSKIEEIQNGQKSAGG